MNKEPSIAACRRLLRERINRFDEESNALRKSCLARLSAAPIAPGKSAGDYVNALLFILAHPADAGTHRLAERELKRVTGLLRKHPRIGHALHVNSGLPYSRVVTRFSHDGLRALLDQPRAVRVALHGIREPAVDLSAILQLTLPEPERAHAQSGPTGISLLDDLGVPPATRIEWLVREAAKLDKLPGVKDHFFDQLGLYVSLTPLRDAFTLAYNRIPVREVYFHTDRLRQIDARALADKPLPSPAILATDERSHTIRVIRNAMALLSRETDPATYLDPSTLQLYRLERGLQIAFFTMTPERQLPYESYVGYTVFKNGLPVSYGGAWIFGDRALFGINIFPPYRGGESAYIMAQLLRGYRQLFKIDHIEIEPYQFGLDNPEGIATGAFWFYYRFGFRPMDSTLCKIADSTFDRMKSEPGFTCPVRTLEAFTASPLAFAFQRPATLPVTTLTSRITGMIKKRFRGDRVRAVDECRNNLLQILPGFMPANDHEDRALTEMSLWAAAFALYEPRHVSRWSELIRLRAADVYGYQAAVRELTIPVRKPE